MKKNLPALVLLALVLMIFGCEKEKIVTSTEYVHDIEYIETPGDTVYRTDTIVTIDSIIRYDTTDGRVDTLLVLDTVMQTITDTVSITEYIHDTITVTNTVVVHDTVTITNTVVLIDTITVIDTVVTNETLPYAHFAFAAMPFHSDPIVLDFINTEFGYDEGWVMYLSLAQSGMENPSAGVYDFCGYIDYWTPDWSGYYALEYCFTMTFVGDDPADPMDWQLTDTPASSSLGEAGLRLTTERKAIRPGN